MRFKDLTSTEQAKVRYLWRGRLRSIDVQPFPRLRQCERAGSLDGIDEQELLAELRDVLHQLDVALSSDFQLEPWMASIVEQDRQRYLATVDDLGGLPGVDAERSALIRRIHHQRIELRSLQRVMADYWRWRTTDRAHWDDWWKREKGWTEESEEACSDVAVLRARLRLQRRQLRSANSVIEQQRQELGAMLQRSIERAAMG